ncbi:sulfotransferase domain-containing protein [Thermodesulfatator atlanticus]|uniref:sulfotransferase domain-containing protein n=1 Tax=Thermodesulfatator atlanticus TaxID=501497 RepID=UPI00146A1E61|nr:sulfotransferase domain-containing protein [Thermodesulfatator atlanticus]
MSVKPEDYIKSPPILANSFPKSGTHLLLQIVEPFPKVKNYKKFIASMPTITFRERSKINTIKVINSILPGEIVAAHLFYDEDYYKALIKLNIAHFFISRDLRDVVVSEAFYLSKMNRWHRLHKYFKSLSSIEDQIMFSIKGNSFLKTPYDYPNIAERFKRYAKWVKHHNIFSLRYEDLMSKKRRQIISDMVQFYLQKMNAGERYNLDELVQKILENINPQKSHTFRKGGSGNWRNFFTNEHKKAMKEVAGDLLIKLGYEKDLDW